MRTTYTKFRQRGYTARWAWQAARTVEAWEGREDVRLRAEPEQENFFDVVGEPEGYTDIHGRRVSAKQEREETCQMLERDGCWVVLSEYWDGTDWRVADSIGMCAGYKDPLSPFENGYVQDLMRAALDAADNVPSLAACQI